MSDDLRLDDVAARVVAWHNRHPLARRITAWHVQSVGYVALPFAAPAVLGAVAPVPEAAAPAAPPAAAEQAPAGGRLRERLLARERQGPAADGADPAGAGLVAASRPPAEVLKAGFSEDFIPPLRPARVARWAARVGVLLARAPADGPLRQVRPEPLPRGAVPLTLHVRTASIEIDGRYSRVLLGAGQPAPVMGRRVWSRPRLALAGTAGLLVLGALALLRPFDGGPEALAEGAAAAASAPARIASGVTASVTNSAAAAAAASAPTDTQAEAAPAPRPAVRAPAAEGAAAAAPAASALAAVLPASAAPEATAKRRGPLALPSLAAQVNDEARAVARIVHSRPPRPVAEPAAEPSAAAAVPPPALAAAVPPAPGAAPKKAGPEPEPARPAAPKAAPAPGATTAAETAGSPAPPQRKAAAFALSTRPLRTRAEAEQVMAAMSALLRTQRAQGVEVEILPEGEDWRVVGWPYARREEAEQARALLVSRGMRVTVVGF
jgi:hypothetical protein